MLTSRQNPLTKQIRQLHQAKGRRQMGAFLLEGTHLLQEAIATNWPLLQVCATPACRINTRNSGSRAIQAAPEQTVSDDLLAYLCTTVNPDGVVANRSTAAPASTAHFSLLADAVETLQDPGNLGTIIRTAAAAGADGLWLTADGVDPDHPKVLRASAGQWFRLPIAIATDLGQTLRSWQQQGYQIVSTLPRATTTLWQADLTRPTVLLLGNEGAGLSPDLAAIADSAVTIPQAAGVESLNVAIAAALLLYEARRQRQS
uniref:rRNA methylase-like protein n=1 Tax=Synechococcus elongatus (strain ATCC 33912 / PCC 7942 / FACHB-805) TaxID=1140 RepID=Q8KPR6_SYNE7|nr:rRNA methylase-like protein [Synechococcus elongatus PCC 7942 = FACHB-805]